MNLLLVDDEVYVVRTLQKKIDWERQGVDRVFTAFNVERAKEIFLQEKIDILLTDIEMPRESWHAADPLGQGTGKGLSDDLPDLSCRISVCSGSTSLWSDGICGETHRFSEAFRDYSSGGASAGGKQKEETTGKPGMSLGVQ